MDKIVPSLVVIGAAAIATHLARRRWLDAKRENRQKFLAYIKEMGEAYLAGDDPNVDASYAERRAAAKEYRAQAAKLRYLIKRFGEMQ